ncbi:MAG: folate-binding protein YgfZ [Alphaproteobacteria bacterium]|nr:folate-binding protein YgfZ [Alphaproteobacteria bacterium]
MNNTMPETPYFVKLKNPDHQRGLIHIEGPDSRDFLQGLITNDITKLTKAAPLYACLLNAQGKFLHDFFLIEGEGVILIDCEGGARAQDLYRRLSMYRLRADVQISVEEDIDVYAIFGAKLGLPDPRHPDMGNRSFEKPNLDERPFDIWDHKRIILTIPDGSRDLIPEKSTMDEASMDQLNAIDYKKGCYIGQELTARMHYRGLGKRKLETIKLDTIPDGAALRSSCGDIGMALVKNS